MTSENKEDSPWFKPSEEAQKEVEFTNEQQCEPYTKEEVEDEILEAREEVIESQTADETVEPTGDEVTPADEVLVETEPATQETESDEETEDVDPVKEEKKKAKANRSFVNALRKNDDVHNRTCAVCLRRRPIQDFARLKQSDVCQDCED